MTVPVAGDGHVLQDIIRAVDSAGVRLTDVAVRKPTLDDVFLVLTGQAKKSQAAEVA